MIGRKASGEQQQQDGLGVEDGLGGERGGIISVWASAAWMAVEMLVNVSDMVRRHGACSVSREVEGLCVVFT